MVGLGRISPFFGYISHGFTCMSPLLYLFLKFETLLKLSFVDFLSSFPQEVRYLEMFLEIT